MGMDLVSKSGLTYQINGTGWAFYLNLAESYGWSPEGTKKPKKYGIFKKWSRVYDTNEGQFVTASDAEKISIALQRAISSAEFEKVSRQIIDNISQAIKEAMGDDFSSYAEISPEVDKNCLVEFISFCQKGGFYID